MVECEGTFRFKSENEIEEFIIFKAIKDVQMPRLALDDQVIFANICQDIFPFSPKPVNFQTVKIKDIFEEAKSNEKKKKNKDKKRSKKEDKKEKSKSIVFKLRDIASSKLQAKGYFEGDTYILRLIQLYEAI
jgi:hypothetical protein